MVYKLEESLGKTLYGLYSSRDSKNKTVFARQLEEANSEHNVKAVFIYFEYLKKSRIGKRM